MKFTIFLTILSFLPFYNLCHSQTREQWDFNPPRNDGNNGGFGINIFPSKGKVENNDQVINAMERLLVLKIPKKTKGDLSLYLSLPSKENFLIKSFNIVKGGKFDIKLTVEEYKALEEQAALKIGKLKLIKNKSNKKVDIGSPKVLIAPSKMDMECKNPVLISDMHGTLDKGDQCTENTIDQITGEWNIPVLVVSTSGSYAKEDLKRLKFKHKSNFLVLESARSFLGIGQSRSSNNEKAERILRQVMISGLCILGFAGDSFHKEGEAAKILRSISYFGVNLRGKTQTVYETEHYTDHYCKLTAPPKMLEKPGNKKCPKHYEKDLQTTKTCELWKIKRSFPRNSRGGWSERPKDELIRLLDSREVFSGSCPATYKVNKKWIENKSKRKIKTICHQNKRVEFSGLRDLFGANGCPDEYEEIEEEKTRSVSRQITMPLNQNQYGKLSKGSVLTQNWCDLKNHIEEKLNKISQHQQR